MHGALLHRRRFYIGSTAVSAHSRQDLDFASTDFYNEVTSAMPN